MQKVFSLLGLSFLFLPAFNLQAQTTAFTYQGRLNLNTNPANGIYDFRFAVYDAVTNGVAVSVPLTNANTAVTSGVFMVTLDFGAAPFPGTNRWLDIGVRTNGSAGAYTTLNPRQRLTASPYAITAVNFSGGLAGDVAGTQSANSVTRLRGVSVASSAPSLNQVLRYNGTAWTPGSVALSSDISGILSVANGGTAQSNYAAGDILYSPAPNILSRRSIGSAGQVLTVSNALPNWVAANNHDHFAQVWTGAADNGLFMQNTSVLSGASALTGSATSTTATNFGVFGQSASSSGTGVEGFAFASSGFSSGVYGESA